MQQRMYISKEIKACSCRNMLWMMVALVTAPVRAEVFTLGYLAGNTGRPGRFDYEAPGLQISGAVSLAVQAANRGRLCCNHRSASAQSENNQSLDYFLKPNIASRNPLPFQTILFRNKTMLFFRNQMWNRVAQQKYYSTAGSGSLQLVVAETYGEEEESILQTARLWQQNVSAIIGPLHTCVHEVSVLCYV